MDAFKVQCCNLITSFSLFLLLFLYWIYDEHQSKFQPRLCLLTTYLFEVKFIAPLTLEDSWLELVTDSEGEILPGLSQQGHVGLVGTEGDEGGWGQRSTGVNQVGRVEAQFMKLFIKT